MHSIARTRPVLLLFFCAAFAVGAAGVARSAEKLLDGIAAQVGSEIVLLSEVRAISRPVEEQMRKAGTSESEILAMQRDALERLIESKLIKNVVHRLELEASDSDVDNAIMGIAQDTGLTIDQLHRSVESHGLTIEEYRHKIKGEIERSKVLNSMVRSRVRVEPKELRALFKERYGKQRTGGLEVHLRHILVASGQGMRDQRTACLIARDALRRIRQGEIGFAEMARRVTDLRPEDAGDLGWLHNDDLAAWMAPVVHALEPGDVSDIVETSFGCNILQLVERREFHAVTFYQAEPKLREELMRHKMEREYLAWLQRMRKRIFIARKGIFATGSANDREGAARTGRATE